MIGHIRTFTGRLVDVRNLQPGDIDLDDICHHLSLMCRWGCACKRFFSVAQHSLWVMRFAESVGTARGYTRDQIDALLVHALLHDMHETYFGDCPTPIKAWLDGLTEDGYAKAREQADRSIYAYFGLERPSLELADAVHEADAMSLGFESHIMTNGPQIYTIPERVPFTVRGEELLQPMEAERALKMAVRYYVGVLKK